MSDHDHNKTASLNMRLRIFTALAFIPVVLLLLNGGTMAVMICLIIGAAMAYEAVTVTGRSIHNPLGLAQAMMLMFPAILVALPQSVHAIVPPFYMLGVVIVGLALTGRDLSAKVLMIILILKFSLCFISMVRKVKILN